MSSVTWRCWVLFQVAAVPMALFCWYATLLWLATVGVHSWGQRGSWALTGREVLLAAGFCSFGWLHLVGLRWGHAVPPRYRWALFFVPLPWLISFLLGQFDDDLSFPGDGMLPPGLQGAACVTYLVLLMALLAAALMVALVEALARSRD